MIKELKTLSSNIHSEDEHELLTELVKLEEKFKEDPQTLKQILQEVEIFFTEHGLTETADWEKELKRIARENPSLLVRRESPKNLFDTLEKKQTLKIGFLEDVSTGKPYPNAAILDNDASGLKTPLTKGFGKINTGALILIAGYNKGKNLEVRSLEQNEFNQYVGAERAKLRKIKGEINYENVKFILARFPRQNFPEDKLTDEELDNDSHHILRLFVKQNEATT